MFARGKSKERASNRKVTPPSPSYMSNEQFASYLADLRQNRIGRPGGARPQPDYARRDSGRPSLAQSKRSSLGGASLTSETSSVNQRGQYPVPPSIISRKSAAGSVTSRYSNSSARGRDYYPQTPGSTVPLKPSEVVPSATYIERGQRWMEKEEAYSLKQAMDDMDLKEREKAEPVEREDEEEKRIHAAALDEAADLVWQHQNGVKPPEPDAPYRYKPHLRQNSYAYARTASTGYNGTDVEPTGLRRDMGSRSASGSSTCSDGNDASSSPVSLASTLGKSGGLPSLEKSRENSMNSDEQSKTYRGLASGPRPMVMKSLDRRRSSLKRNISGEVQRPFSGDQIWEEPEGASSPGAKASSSKAAQENAQPLRAKAKNPLNRVQFAAEMPSNTPNLPEVPPRPVSKIEIHRNPPSQSRNPLYTSNASSEAPAAPREDVPRKNGVEIRGDDIRLATSMKLKDRSEKLPTPAFVSDSPGRPIVSFDATWKVPEKDQGTDKKPDPRHRSPFFRRDQAAKEQSPASNPATTPSSRPQPQPAALRQAASVPTISVVENRDMPRPQSTPQQQQQQPRDRSICSPPAIQVESVAESRTFAAASSATIPSIAVSEPEAPPKAPSIPSISVAAPPAIPSIVTPDDDDDNSGPKIPTVITPVEASNSSSTSQPAPSARPLPTPVRGPAGRIRHEAQRSRGHWSPAPKHSTGSRATARCHECRQYIEGRFVALGGGNERFHPQCFTCYTCGTSLEALEISPEPGSFRAARLERVARRQAGESLAEEPGQTMAEDGDERLRFFCHLDWHEQFAPKCKHCRTPIIGEHVVALGAHWHYGHFFCAECGDPFQQGMTHIEKDGYAWCVSCQTKRTERRAPKCKGCKKAVIGQYVRALGGEWHDECFRCGTCGGGFDDGQVFPREASDGFIEVLCTPCRARELKG